MYYNKKEEERREFFHNISFRDKEGNLTKELLYEKAKKTAEYFEKSNLTTSQLRKFYNEVKSLEAKIEATEGNDDEKYKKNEALIYMLISKVNYSYNRDKSKVEALKDFIEEMVPKIKNLQDFKDFAKFFEAIVGFADLKRR
uniref:CRISPR system Cms protein Csm2 n=1 Tax=candidate division WOR-3 bacterium TaxID=2052148 RepID=A0A7C4UBY4_UNCW3